MEELLVKQLYDFATGKKEDIPIEFHYVYKLFTTWQKKENKPIEIKKPIEKEKVDFQAFLRLVIQNMTDTERKACRTFFKAAFESLKISDNPDFEKLEHDNEFWRKFFLYFELHLNVKISRLNTFINEESWIYTDSMIKDEINESDFLHSIDRNITTAAPEYFGFFVHIGYPDYKYDNPERLKEYKKEYNLGPY